MIIEVTWQVPEKARCTLPTESAVRAYMNGWRRGCARGGLRIPNARVIFPRETQARAKK